MPMLELAVEATQAFIEQKPKSQRKAYGQFFTSQATAEFMASMFNINSKGTNAGSIKILDPGAGSGILAIALVERLQHVSEVQGIKLVCYETDSNVLPLLQHNLELAQQLSRKPLEFEILNDNYILSQTQASSN